MRKKRLVNVLTSAALTAALVMSMGMTAMADDLEDTETKTETNTEINTKGVYGSGVETEEVSSVTITKTVKTDGNTYQPNTSFSFTVKTGSEGTYNDDTIYEGINEGLSISDNADFTYKNDETYEVGSSFSATATLTVDSTKFADATPGIYHYEVEENSSTYSGVTTDNAYYDVYVYVLNNGTNNYVGYVVAVKNEVDEAGHVTSSSKANLSFTNDYGADETIDSTHDLTITKELAGDLQNASDSFKVTVKVNDEGATGQYYQLIVRDENGNTVSGYDKLVNNTASSEISIKKGYTITINGLTENAVVTVEETDTNGYTASYTKTPTGMTENENNGAILSGKISSDNAEATLTNTKSATTPTGIILNFAPYILLVAFAGVFAVLFLGKKREEV